MARRREKRQEKGNRAKMRPNNRNRPQKRENPQEMARTRKYGGVKDLSTEGKFLSFARRNLRRTVPKVTEKTKHRKTKGRE